MLICFRGKFGVPRYSIILLLLIFSIYWEVESVTDPLLDELLKRNGDVYLLVSDSSTDTGHLYRFDRSDQYSRGDVIPNGSPSKHSYRNMWVLLWTNSVM